MVANGSAHRLAGAGHLGGSGEGVDSFPGEVPASGGVALVGDKTWQVRYALANNPHSGPALWRAIVGATRTDIRMVFAQNLWMPQKAVYYRTVWRAGG